MSRAKSIARLLLLVVAILAYPSLTEAQGLGSQQGSQSSLQALQQLMEQLDLPGLGQSSGSSILDNLRNGASDDENEKSVVLPGSDLSDPLELEIAKRFCSGELPDGHELLLTLGTKFSSSERDYCRRIGFYLIQGGYDTFRGEFKPAVLSTGAAQDTFVLGIGDQLVITFIGGDAGAVQAAVDSEGLVVLPSMSPISAAGLTLGGFKKVLQARIEEAFIGTEAFVALGSIREFGVVVAGEVERPGLHRVTAISSVIDILGLAGGVKKTGSLRGIKVIRQGREISIDLYGAIFGLGEAEDITLKEGDRVIVPTLGRTAAVVGDVRRPIIVEISPGQTGMELSEALNLAGGTLRPRGNRLFLASIDISGQQVISPIVEEQRLRDGDIVTVVRGSDREVGGIELVGHVRVPGRRALAAAPTIGALLAGGQALKDGAYPLFAVLATRDPTSQVERFYGLPLHRIVSGQEDFQFRNADKLLILSRDDVGYLNSAAVRRVATSQTLDLEEPDNEPRPATNDAAGGRSTNLQAIEGTTDSIVGFVGRGLVQSAAPSEGDQVFETSSAAPSECRAVAGLRKLVSETSTERFAITAAVAQRGFNDTAESQARPGECREIYERFPSLLPFVLEHSALIAGEVRQPGLAPVPEATSLGTVLNVVGGLSRAADRSSLEVTRLVVRQDGSRFLERQSLDITQGIPEFFVGPGDAVRASPSLATRDPGVVEVFGEVSRPGVYTIGKGERLSELISRAGGLTVQAYPYGAVFARERIKAAEKRSLDRLARQLSSAVTVAAANRGIDPSAATAFSVLSDQIRQTPATGRVVIEADPTVLQVRPELDIVLEAGDKFYVPKRPNSVLVTGDVLSPGALQFVAGRTVDNYISQAGGFQSSADRSRMFVVFPNGAATPVSVSPFRFSTLQVPPGSTIVVPKDATPFDLFTITREVASLVSQLAITAASLAVISDN